jgi:hypothetical protein
MAKNRIQIVIGAVDKGFRATVGKATRLIGKLKSSVFSLKGLLVGGLGAFGLGALGKSFTDTASTFEDLEISLTTVTGSLEKARAAMAFANKEAAASPFTVLQYAEAYRTLASYGLDAEANLKTLGDTAAAMGKPLQQAVEALADAVQGEGERLKEFGIKQRMQGDKIVYTWTDALGKVRETIAENNPKIIEAALKGIWNEKFKGGMERFANSWSGLTSTAKSLWDDFKRSIMDSGPFQALKGTLKGLIAEVDRLKASGKFDEIAGDFGKKIISGLKTFINALPDLARGIIKGAEMLMLSLSGWGQMRKAWEIMFLQVRIWSLEIINELRLVFVRLLSGLDSLPGVDTKAATRDTYDDIGNTFARIESKGGLADQLEQAKVALGQVQIKQDEISAKFEDAAASAEKAFGRVRDVAIKGIEDGMKAAAEKAEKAAKATQEVAKAQGQMRIALSDTAEAYEIAAGKAKGYEAALDGVLSKQKRIQRLLGQLNTQRSDMAGPQFPNSFSVGDGPNLLEDLDSAAKLAERTGG